MNENLRRAVEALEAGAQDARRISSQSFGDVRGRLRRTIEEALDHLERDQVENPSPEDIVGNLDRQAQSIADDLRRVEQLMKRHTGRQ